MEQKLSYLVDRNQPFTQERVQLLDQLTLAITTNSPQVVLPKLRHVKPMKFGAD